MAQGAIKSKKLGVPSKKPGNPLGLRKGAKVIAPKNKKLVQAQKASKKLSAGLTAKTERMLAEKAGHLELLAGGKRSAKDKAKDKGKRAEKAKGAGTAKK